MEMSFKCTQVIISQWIYGNVIQVHTGYYFTEYMEMSFKCTQVIISLWIYGNVILTLCYWPIYIWEREREEEVGSGDPTSLPWPIWKLSCDWSVDTKTNHRLVSWFPGSAKASPGNQETRWRDQLVPQTINHGFPYSSAHRLLFHYEYMEMSFKCTQVIISLWIFSKTSSC